MLSHHTDSPRQRLQPETFADYGIYVDPRGADVQRVVCPECSHKRQPKHQKERDLTVWLQEGSWACAHCGWGAGLHLRGFTKGTTGADNGNLRLVSPSRPAIKPLAEETTKGLRAAGERVFAFFAARGIPREVVERNGIKARVRGTKAEICFPFVVGGEIVNIKYRDMDEKKYYQEAGASKVFFGLDDIVGATECFITEGECDKMAFDTAGFTNSVSVPDGAPNDDAVNVETKFSFLETCLPYFERMEKIYLAVDNDANGRRLQRELAARLGRLRCWIVEFPEGCKDANDVLVTYGAQALRQTVEEAKPYPIDGILNVMDYRPQMDVLFEKGIPPAPRSGFSKFDEIFKMLPGMFTVITGIPSHGKTLFLDNWLLGLASRSGVKTAIYSRENTPDVHTTRLCEIVVGKPFLPTYSGQMSRDEYDRAMEFLSNHIFQLYDYQNERSFKLLEMMDMALHLKRTRGVQVLVIDTWNKVHHEMLPKENTRDYIARQLRELITFARRSGLHVIVVAHPRKMALANDGVNHVPPDEYSISESADWANMPDNVLTVYRYFYVQNKQAVGKSSTKVEVRKCKHEFMGKQRAFVMLDYMAGCHRFVEQSSVPEYGGVVETESVI